MTGRAMFNEVFIDEARVSVHDVIGGLNNGWAVANTTLMVERASIGSGWQRRPGRRTPGSIAGHLTRRVGDFGPSLGGSNAGSVGGGTVGMLRRLAESLGVNDDPIVRLGPGRTAHPDRTQQVERRPRPQRSGPDRRGGQPRQVVAHAQPAPHREVANHIIGAQGDALGSDRPLEGRRPGEMTVFSRGRPSTAGTDQIQRNIAAERGLGLPKEPGDPVGSLQGPAEELTCASETPPTPPQPAIRARSRACASSPSSRCRPSVRHPVARPSRRRRGEGGAPVVGRPRPRVAAGDRGSAGTTGRCHLPAQQPG